MNTETCILCNQTKKIEEFVKRKNSRTGYARRCRECHNKECIAKFRSLTSEEKKRIAKEHYAKRRKSFRESDKIEDQIYFWATKWRGSARYNNKGISKDRKKLFLTRKNITQKGLEQKAIEGKQKFPEMEFFPNNQNNLLFRASVDRIDSLKPYSDDNIQVIPNWLNSAKLDMELDKFNSVIEDYYKRFIKKDINEKSFDSNSD